MLRNRDRTHAMAHAPFPFFTHKLWAPADLGQLASLSPVNLRDLRRRKLAPAGEGRRLRLEHVAQLLLQSEMVAHGFGPKRIQSIAERYARGVMAFALMEPTSWVDEDTHRAWIRSPSSRCGARYVLIAGQAAEAQSEETLIEALSSLGSVVTVLDLKSLGLKLSSHLAMRPSFASYKSAGET